MPGFVSYKDFTAGDGESVSIVEFDSPQTLAAWREHPEHKIAQQRARDEFFAEYRISVCTPVRETAWSR
jgi:heme-degrading monooxygenase HmoA